MDLPQKESEPMRHQPSQTGWLITIGSVQHVWSKVSEKHRFKFLETRNLNQDALENTFGVTRSHCGSNNCTNLLEALITCK